MKRIFFFALVLLIGGMLFGKKLFVFSAEQIFIWSCHQKQLEVKYKDFSYKEGAFHIQDLHLFSPDDANSWSVHIDQVKAEWEIASGLFFTSSHRNTGGLYCQSIGSIYIHG